MRYRYLGVLMCCIFLLSETEACINAETKMLKNKLILFEDHHEWNTVPEGHNFDLKNRRAQYLAALEELGELYQETNDPAYRIDQGVVYLVLGQYKEAVDLYLQVEKDHPNQYATATNLGTAYELLGQNAAALEWIKRGIERNPKSHGGSEWIHVNILRAKLEGPTAYNSDFLIGVNFGTEARPETNMDREALKTLHKHLYTQLNERLSFVKDPDPIVAELLFALGNLALVLDDYHLAQQDYRKAAEYGYKGALLDHRIADAKGAEQEAERRRLAREERHKARQTVKQTQQDRSTRRQLLVFLFVGVVGVASILWRRRR